MTEFLEKINKAYRKGLFDILGSGLISKLLFFAGNLFVVRFLTKAEYGAFGYADSIMSFIITLNGLGITNGVLQFCCEDIDRDSKKRYEAYGLFFGLLVSILFSIFCLLIAFFGSFKIEDSRLVFTIYALYPITYFLLTYYFVVLRCYDENKKYANIRNINALLFAVCEIVGTFFFNEVAIVVALYISSIVATILGYRCAKLAGGQNYVSKFNISAFSYLLKKQEKIEFIKYSIFTSLNQVVTNLVGFVDVLLIGIIIANPSEIAAYKVATVIPMALMFIPDAILMFFYPYFAKYRNNKDWLKENTRKLFVYSVALNILIVAFLVVFAPYIITILWGKKYISSVFPFRVLSCNYFISATFRYNIIYIMNAMRKVRAVLIVNIISGILDIGLNYLLISKFGAFGAAFATLLTITFTTSILVPLFIKTFKYKS